MLAFLVVAEWLYPLPYMSDTAFLPLFLFVTAIFFIITAIPMHWLMRFLIFAIMITFSLDYIFIPETYLSIGWWSWFITEVGQQSGLVLSGEWLHLSELYRSLLLFVLLAIVSYLTYYWVVIARQILFFIVASVVYLGVLDVFTAYDGSLAIIRLFFLGFLLFACLQLSRMNLRYPNVKAVHWGRFLTVALTVMVLAVLVGWQAPKYAQQWPDPLPYIEEATGIDTTGWGGDEQTRRIGYGENDERLGGGFVMDDVEVFTARAETSDYWRGESKNEYTGHGWSDVEEPEVGPEMTEQLEGEAALYEEATETETLEADVSFSEQFSGEGDVVFSQGALQDASADTDEEHSIFINNENGRAEFWSGEALDDPLELTLSYDDPQFPIERMQEVDHEDYEHSDPETISDKHLQLPDELPERVGELAADVVEGEDNRYDRARAIEDHLTGPDFEYETSDVPVPEDGQDYVDQFLFETQIGYCDNFSTAMVVMLRSVDIPARWVKGFTSGEEVSVEDDGYNEYEVSNENAHSWVEVYFPDVGWVPFEPTPGFSNETDFAMADAEEGEIEEEREFDQEFEQDAEEMMPDEEESDEEANADEEATDEDENEFPLGLLGGIGAGLFLVGVTTFVFRGKLIRMWMQRRYRGMTNGSVFARAYEALLWYLGWVGLKRAGHETPREFAERVDDRFDTKHMSSLTALYEDFYYGNQELKALPTDTEQRWMQMIEKISNN